MIIRNSSCIEVLLQMTDIDAAAQLQQHLFNHFGHAVLTPVA
ncbi:hypothetical protein Spp001_52 [Shewanella phage Spp001]|uniref:Uncharacterized protein n=1 Tax=Shewanella phage Spp001 TaxID=1445859 RepID=W6EBW4_9CAUD|nr:hypothetical protein Spp001_52 [Shewanella phage Spp001]AHJ10560.1 hypothetical protein Spp001_52 [Shewanella phage Spp001]